MSTSTKTTMIDGEHPKRSTARKGRPRKQNLASNGTKAALLLGSLWVTVLGGQALARETATLTTTDAGTDSAVTDVVTDVAADLTTNGVTDVVTVGDLLEIPTVDNPSVDLNVEPFTYTLPQTGTVTTDGIADAGTDSANDSVLSQNSLNIPLPALAVPATGNADLNLAPIPTAAVPSIDGNVAQPEAAQSGTSQSDTVQSAPSRPVASSRSSR